MPGQAGVRRRCRARECIGGCPTAGVPQEMAGQVGVPQGCRARECRQEGRPAGGHGHGGLAGGRPTRGFSTPGRRQQGVRQDGSGTRCSAGRSDTGRPTGPPARGVPQGIPRSECPAGGFGKGVPQLTPVGGMSAGTMGGGRPFLLTWLRRGQCPRASPIAHGDDRSAEAPWSHSPRGDRPPLSPLTAPAGLPRPAGASFMPKGGFRHSAPRAEWIPTQPLRMGSSWTRVRSTR